MKAASVRFNSISSILITHLHGDHCWGVFGLLCTVASQGRTDPVLLVGPKGLRQMIVTVLGSAGGFYGMPLRFLELEPETAYPDLGLINAGVHLAAFPLKHRVASFGYVLREGIKPGALDVEKAKQAGATGKQLGTLKSGQDVILPDGKVIRASECVGSHVRARRIALLQDTYDSSSAKAACQEIDLLIHECTYSRGMHTKAIAHGHSTSEMLGRYAAECNARMIAMTHFSNRYETRDQTKVNREKQAAKDANSTTTAATKTNGTVAAAESQLQNLSLASSSASTSSSASVAPASSSAAEPAESDVLTLDELVAEATLAYISSHPSSLPPPGGVVAAEDFLVIESLKEDFRVAPRSDRLVADYELAALQRIQAEATSAVSASVSSSSSAKASKPTKENQKQQPRANKPNADATAEAATAASTSTPLL
jgi:ribonuclease Z